MVGVAVNVTDVPEQIVEALAAIETEAAPAVFTTIVTVLDVAGDPLAQPKLDVIITVTTSPFANVVVVNVDEFVPTLPPFTCH